MTKFRLIGVAAVLVSVLAGPAMARHVISVHATPPRASFVRPGKREIPTASIAITRLVRMAIPRRWDSTLDNAC